MNEWRGAACSETTQRVSEAEGEGEWSWFFFFLLWGVMGGAPRHSSAQRRKQKKKPTECLEFLFDFDLFLEEWMNKSINQMKRWDWRAVCERVNEINNKPIPEEMNLFIEWRNGAACCWWNEWTRLSPSGDWARVAGWVCLSLWIMGRHSGQCSAKEERTKPSNPQHSFSSLIIGMKSKREDKRNGNVVCFAIDEMEASPNQQTTNTIN